jgi:two-component system chemotaxis response regulator CheY
MKILVVDDSAMMRKLIVRAIRASGCPDTQIVEAGDGLEALAAIDRHGPSIDLILCDINMPNVSGLSLLRSLRSTPEFRRTPFFVVTADGSDDAVRQALSEGAAGVIGKPFRPEDIAAIVRERRSKGKGATSSAFKTDTVVGMIRAMSRSGGAAAR